MGVGANLHPLFSANISLYKPYIRNHVFLKTQNLLLRDFGENALKPSLLVVHLVTKPKISY